MHFDKFDQVLDAVVGEGHHIVVAEPVNPNDAIFGIHSDADIMEPSDAFAEVFGDAVDCTDMVDLIDVHGYAA